jgi:hypothetical protein
MIPIPGTFTLQATLIAGAVALVAGLGAGAYATHSWYAPKLELAETQRDALASDIRQQNRGIEATVKAAKEQAAKSREAVAAALAARKQAETDAQRLLGLQPPAGVDRCTAASELITRELGK